MFDNAFLICFQVCVCTNLICNINIPIGLQTVDCVQTRFCLHASQDCMVHLVLFGE